jgi:hypothetical protein
MRIFAIVAMAVLTVSCAVILETYQSEYSAKPITLKIVDEAGLPVEGVIATANWELLVSKHHGSTVRGQMKVLEALSNAEGDVYFPAWGPERNSHGGHIETSDPQIHLYKRGYLPERLNNYAVCPQPWSPTGCSRDSVRVSMWDGKTIRLTRTRDSKLERAGLEGMETDLDFAFPLSHRSCEWTKIPRMTAVLVEAKIIDRYRLNEERCGSFDAILKASR